MAFTKNTTDEQRFWSRVRKGPGCWNWQGSVVNGYGRFFLGSRLLGNRREMKTHRYSYELAKGKIPPEMLVRHSCDNPRCVNPDHLLLGTQQDNMTDKVQRGRQSRGERHGNAILSDEAVKEIRAAYGVAPGRRGRRPGKHISQAQLAKRFGVTQEAISAIVRNTRRSSHVG